mmetsp:Transcript_18224/g.40810  ORF Transcript_18224/g.40810 Transcript_18224/m.40810 type:complete len:291 (-) Transcript_18224:40-912(-)
MRLTAHFRSICMSFAKRCANSCLRRCTVATSPAPLCARDDAWMQSSLLFISSHNARFFFHSIFSPCAVFGFSFSRAATRCCSTSNSANASWIRDCAWLSSSTWLPNASRLPSPLPPPLLPFFLRLRPFLLGWPPSSSPPPSSPPRSSSAAIKSACASCSASDVYSLSAGATTSGADALPVHGRRGELGVTSMVGSAPWFFLPRAGIGSPLRQLSCRLAGRIEREPTPSISTPNRWVSCTQSTVVPVLPLISGLLLRPHTRTGWSIRWCSWPGASSSVNIMYPSRAPSMVR